MRISCRVKVNLEKLILVVDTSDFSAAECFRRTRRVDSGEVTVRVEEAMTSTRTITVASDDLPPIVKTKRLRIAPRAGIGVVDSGEYAVRVEKAVFISTASADPIRPHDLSKIVQAARSRVADRARDIDEGKDAPLFESRVCRTGESEAVANLPKDFPLIVYAQGAAEGEAGSGARGAQGRECAARIEKAVYVSCIIEIDPDDLT
jgi:hypothetical protein